MSNIMEESSRNRVIPFITGDMFVEVERMYREQDKLSDEALLALHAVFGAPLERALELLEKKCVTLLTTPNGSRQALQVSGGRGELYTLFPNINFCPCLAFTHQVVTSRSHITCKHVLAAKLSQLLGQTERKEVTSQEIARILSAPAYDSQKL